MSKKHTGRKPQPEPEPPKDTSPKVYNPPKIDFELTIREFPWNKEQQELIEVGLKKETRVVLCQSKAGTGKTLVALYVALKRLQQKRIAKIYFVRSPVESASKGIGFLPGLSEEKMLPYSMPAMDNLNELLPPAQIKKLFDGGFIEVLPLGFLKGRSLGVCAIICDESEDFTILDGRLVLSRMGKYSTIFLIGDKKQSNIRDSGFEKIYQLFDDDISKSRGIYSMELSEVMRNDVLSYILDKFDELNERGSSEWQPRGQK